MDIVIATVSYYISNLLRVFENDIMYLLTSFTKYGAKFKPIKVRNVGGDKP